MSLPLDLSPARTSAPWLGSLVANIQDAIVLLDSAGAVIFESPSAGEILGIEPDDVLRKFGLDRIHPDEREAVVRSFERTIAEPGAVARATYRFQRSDGEWRHLEAIAKNLIEDPDLRGVLITFRDVTERIQALDAAERAGRARDEFLSRMSHELRTPLHAILGWSQLLEAREDSGVQEAAGQIAGAGHHLLRLVDETLDLAAVREGRISIDAQPIPVEEVVLDAMELIRPLARERDVDVRVGGLAPSAARVVADARRLRQVLINLLSNAVKYNRFGGEAVVGWRIDPQSDGIVRIWIRDTGPGIAPERLNRVFERFERLGMESVGVEGSGLGLAISRRLVEMMGGTIGVDSSPGAGSEFWITLRAAGR